MRGWSHGQKNEIFSRSTAASGADGIRARRGLFNAVVGYRVHVGDLDFQVILIIHIPWVEYLLGVVILGAWRELEKRVGVVEGARGAKTKMVLDVIESFFGEFSVGDLRTRCPTVGIDLIRRVLRQQREAGRVECLGRGPRAKWRRIG